ncbi:GNAT family N-acetyltransferase [Alginatibacterium sediminis]|uniref:GNAT family N-acetyltransferase n=1 Tax=Alginatibacterium sediminis TaxID=2164068 RepID=A0A420E7J8_9ALTE|nr:GNAT family N-acetyltransferase [Alginatibacterium sediminis]RKF14496.1 GNAT family N-acetyltransferase [Alginatibacterium sediminis]
MGKDILLRVAMPGDSRTIALVQLQAWRSAYNNIMCPEYLGSLNLDSLESHWHQALIQPSPGTTLVLECQERIVAFGVYGPARDSHFAGLGYAELCSINVSPDCWTMGYGKILIQEMEAQIKRRWPKLYLWVAQDNQRAINFYGKNGYHDSTQRRSNDSFSATPFTEQRFDKNI